MFHNLYDCFLKYTFQSRLYCPIVYVDFFKLGYVLRVCVLKNVHLLMFGWQDYLCKNASDNILNSSHLLRVLLANHQDCSSTNYFHFWNIGGAICKVQKKRNSLSPVLFISPVWRKIRTHLLLPDASLPDGKISNMNIYYCVCDECLQSKIDP